MNDFQIAKCDTCKNLHPPAVGCMSAALQKEAENLFHQYLNQYYANSIETLVPLVELYLNDGYTKTLLFTTLPVNVLNFLLTKNSLQVDVYEVVERDTKRVFTGYGYLLYHGKHPKTTP